MDTKKLRQKILDLAIRGKLVPQDPNDEPASVLLERIREEKERLIKEGKIKKSKKSATTSDKPHCENVPFEVPEGWCWCKLEDIAFFGGGKTLSMDIKEYWENGSHLWVTSKDMKTQYIEDSLMKITDMGLSVMTQYDKGTILMVTRSGILRHTLPLAILNVAATVNQDLKTISCYLKSLSKYIYYAIKAQEAIILTEYHKDGTTVDSIDFDKFKTLFIPLPPLSEQTRIIQKIEKGFTLINDIDLNETDLQSTIKQTKSKILDLAIQGKLVPQDPNDEPASELLKRINPKAEIACDNAHYEQLPFEIPKSWIWTTLGDIITIKSGDSIKVRDHQNGYFPIYGGNGITGYSDAYNIDKPTIVIGRVGFYCGSIHFVNQKAWITDNAFITTIKNNPLAELNQCVLDSAYGFVVNVIDVL